MANCFHWFDNKRYPNNKLLELLLVDTGIPLLLHHWDLSCFCPRCGGKLSNGGMFLSPQTIAHLHNLTSTRSLAI